MKQLIKWLLGLAGYQVHRIGRSESILPTYQACTMAALSTAGELSVAIVGANDGKTNDPFYELLLRYPELKNKTQVILIEPQAQLISKIEENYKSHPAHFVQNVAIGGGNALKMYCIREEYWCRLQPGYAKDWPLYRAPTGVTSFDKATLAQWVRRHGRGIDPDDAIAPFEAPCRTLIDVTRALALPPKVDVLQIDTEGCDDEVIYNSNIDELRPGLILYESKQLSVSARQRLEGFLESRGFALLHGSNEDLAVRIA